MYCSDGLQRHLASHGEEFKPKTLRSKRACVACHASKIKCSGAEPCLRCAKKDVECVYSQKDQPLVEVTLQDQASTLQSTIPNPPGVGAPPQDSLSMHDLSSMPNFEQPSKQSASLNLIGDFCPIQNLVLDDDVNINKAQEPENDHMPLPSQARSPGLINWTNLRVEEDNSPLIITREPGTSDSDGFLRIISIDDIVNLYRVSKDLSTKYLRLYFTQFHFRWQFVHQPTYDEYESPYGMISSLIMIGAWMQGTDTSRQFAKLIHDRLMNELFPLLVRCLDFTSLK